ncbi:MAG: isopentenyl-diphosphate Delta-isomerase [Gammaproteobacteria bacterium]
MADATDNRVVSFESEKLVLVDESDREVGYETKAACHDGQGILHRAFSLFIFNDNGELLLQQRSKNKRLWPGYWANSCCSHPHRGEAMDEAVQRRLKEELGFTCALEFVYKFQYHAAFGTLGSETELCWVYTGMSFAPVHVNENEIAAWRFIAPAALDHEMAATPAHFTPWLKLEWQRLRHDFADKLPVATGEHRRSAKMQG